MSDSEQKSKEWKSGERKSEERKSEERKSEFPTLRICKYLTVLYFYLYSIYVYGNWCFCIYGSCRIWIYGNGKICTYGNCCFGIYGNLCTVIYSLLLVKFVFMEAVVYFKYFLSTRYSQLYLYLWKLLYIANISSLISTLISICIYGSCCMLYFRNLLSLWITVTLSRE